MTRRANARDVIANLLAPERIERRAQWRISAHVDSLDLLDLDLSLGDLDTGHATQRHNHHVCTYASTIHHVGVALAEGPDGPTRVKDSSQSSCKTNAFTPATARDGEFFIVLRLDAYSPPQNQ